MLKYFINKLGTDLYVQIWENRIKVTDIRTGKVFDEAPLLATRTEKGGRKVVVAVGDEVNNIPSDENIEITNPFSHPRALLNDFFVAEKLLQYIVRTLLGKKWISPSPRVVIHPMEKGEGGLTVIEHKAFRELALGAGARKVVLHQGQVLSTSLFDFEKIEKENEETTSHQIESSNENVLSIVIIVVLLLVMFWFSGAK